MTYKAAIFDLDGTMFDNHAYHQQACIQLCHKYGLKLTEQDFSDRFVGKTTRDFVIELFGDISEEEVAAYDYEKEALYRELYKDDIAPIPGLVEFLNALVSDGYILGVATSAPIENLTFSLEALSIQSLFSSLLCITDVENPKPDPEIYLRSMGLLKASPDNTIVFEDSGPGIEAAKRSKAKVIGIRTSMIEEQFGNVEMTIADYTEISPETLNKLLL
jgi:HAD superfamily hydrolase (TIGR01509 family)